MVNRLGAIRMCRVDLLERLPQSFPRSHPLQLPASRVVKFGYGRLEDGSSAAGILIGRTPSLGCPRFVGAPACEARMSAGQGLVTLPDSDRRRQDMIGSTEILACGPPGFLSAVGFDLPLSPDFVRSQRSDRDDPVASALSIWSMRSSQLDRRRSGPVAVSLFRHRFRRGAVR